MVGRCVYGCIFCVCLNFHLLSAQPEEIEVRGRFLVDSVRLGEPVPFAMTARYPLAYSMIFADSTHNFSPLEWSGVTYFSAQMRDDRVYDSVIYYLSTFDTLPRQVFRLSAQLIRGEDTSVVYTRADTLHIKDLALPSVAQRDLEAQVDYQEVALGFDYKLLMWVLGGLCFVALIALLLLRRPLRRWWKRRRLVRQYKCFSFDFRDALSRLERSYDPSQLERALSIWKRYLETLQKKPYQKMSTTEICALSGNAGLDTHLVPLDAALYGAREITSCVAHLEALFVVAEERYFKQLKYLQLYG